MNRTCGNRSGLTIAVLSLTALAVLSTEVAFAQVPPYNTVLRVSVTPRFPDGTTNTIATLGQAKDGSVATLVRSFDRRSGLQAGGILVLLGDASVRFTDVLLSVVFEPNDLIAGVQHMLVLDSVRRVHIFALGFQADGTPFLAMPTRTIGPFGPTDAGAGAVLGETLVVNTISATVSFREPVLGIGTMNGEVILVTEKETRRAGGEVICDNVAPGPIQDLGSIAQVGFFALGAVSNGTLFLINPDADADLAGLQPRLTASLRDPRPLPLIDFSSPVLTRESEPFIDPLANLIVTANGGAELTTLEIPPNPGFGDVMTVRAIDPTCSPVKQVVFGSLTWLPFDGAGVLYNAGFTLEEGIVGRIWTIAGASMEVAPETLNLASGGGFVTVRIEAENNRAAEIDGPTLTLSVDGVNGAVPVSVHPPPTLLNFDGDLNVDLEAKFDRAELNTLLAQTSASTAVVRARWLYSDGAEGTASALISVKR